MSHYQITLKRGYAEITADTLIEMVRKLSEQGVSEGEIVRVDIIEIV